MTRYITLLVCCFLFPQGARSQDAAKRIQLTQPRPAEVRAAVEALAQAGAEGTGAPTATTTTQSSSNAERTKQRQAVLQKLTFDRRPSAILNVWSEPAKKKDEKEEPKDETKTPANDPPKQDDKPLTEEEKKAKEEAEKKQKEAAALKKEIEELRAAVTKLKRDVTLARWSEVGAFLKALDEAEQKSVYSQLLASLVAGPPNQRKTRSGQIIGERNVIRARDVIELAELCPVEKLEDSYVALLGSLVNLCQVEGQAKYIFLDTLTAHVNGPAEGRKIDKRIAARILFAANRIEQSREFLPTVEEAVKENDTEALDVLTDVFMRLYSSEQEKSLLEQSWNAAQALLAYDETEQKRREKALRHCVKLVPMVRAELGDAWLADSFTSEPERGMEILAAIGGASARSMHELMSNTTERLAVLKLQQTAVGSLLKTAADKATRWQQTMHLMAANWLREATYSGRYDRTSQRGAYMTRDMYGNYFWSNGSSSAASVPSGMPQPIPSGKVLDVRPDEAWLKFLDEGYRSRFAIETARLHLRVKEEAEAFPYIEQLAETHKSDARDLVKEFLDVWAENHDPNTQTRRTSIYMFSYGFSRRASGIPLTRSRQERNLAELAKWCERIRSLPIDDIDERWISAAFIRVHSSAEVYRLDDMQKVFGDIEAMEPDTLAAMLQTMRGNLAGIWRKPEVQQQAGTKRKKPDIEAEVVEGYKSARQLCNQALKDHPDSWRLQLVEAALSHDENDYRSELQATSEYAVDRKKSLASFQKAATSYAETVPDLKESEYSVEAFQFWFNAALGAPDLDQITQDKQAMLTQIPLIKTAIDELPQESRAKHLSMFANDVFTRMSRVNPAVKFRYVREGLNIVGEHEQAREARKVFDYYNDLVTEIKLETVLDGSPIVGSEQPFGVFVNLRHTKAIERESGGFARYFQNQNNGSGYFYNYGRPTENYRDKFEQSARDALDEHFEVLSVTFQPETITSRATAEPGWRTTSYAYLLLKARGPEIDRVAPLKLDLDFLDTTGYAVLPVQSQAISVDCQTTTPEARPVDKLSVTQTLDERQSKDGKLILEIKATGLGLVPELDEILDLKFADFEVLETEDNGLSVSRFDPDTNEPVVVSDRLWTLTLADKSEAATDARTFMFASARQPLHEELWQVYDDADLVEAEQSVTLREVYDEPNNIAAIAVAGVAALLLLTAVVWFLSRKNAPEAKTAEQRFRIPSDPTPFNVLQLLKDIERNNGLSPDGKAELANSINRIERFYFADERTDEVPDLTGTAERWVAEAR